jgi:creatinine amidohydrolase/Fe(II)-dependent formamide hydrolase-like protein
MPKKKSVWYHELSWPEIVQKSKECDIILLPVGSIEMHGPHCPTGSDSLNAQGIAERVAEKTGTIVATPFWYGPEMYMQHGFPGSIPVRSDVVKQFAKDVISGLIKNGFKKVIVLNGHGQQWVYVGILQELALETKAFIAVATWWELIRKTINETCETPMVHAGEVETSLALELYPDLVDMNKADKESAPTTVNKKWFGGPTGYPEEGGFPGHNITCSYFQVDTYKLGILGDATKATKEKGKKMVDAVVDKLSEFIEELKAKYPPGVSPLEKHEQGSKE